MSDTARQALEQIAETARWYADNPQRLQHEVDHCLCVEILDLAERAVAALSVPPAPPEQRDWPEHLRDDAPYLVCSACARRSWASKEGDVCGLPQPDGSLCAGTFAGPVVPLVDSEHEQEDLGGDR